ncbi:MAG: ABC transporter permease [Lachnospiraceae bacterium]
MKKDKPIIFYIGAALCALMAFLFLMSLVYLPYDPDAMSGSEKFMPPSFAHWMGTDNFGRDIFSRLLRALQNSCRISFFTVMAGGGIGVLIGALTGYFGGFADELLMRINDVITAFPSVLLALVIISLLGTGERNVILALAIVFIPSFARVTRSEFLKYRNKDYVKSAKLAGASPLRIIFFHIFPNVCSTLLTSVLIGLNNAILAEAGMSYLGIGVQPPDASLGCMLSDAQTYLYKAPWYMLFPALTMILLLLGLSLLGDSRKERNA